MRKLSSVYVLVHSGFLKRCCPLVHYSSYHVYPHLAIYFSSPFGRYPTCHTLTSVTRKKLSVCVKMLSLFRAVVKFYYSDYIGNTIEI